MRPTITRRAFLAGAGATLACAKTPTIRTAVPRHTHGVQSGDVQAGRALVWARCDQPARMMIEWDTTDRFTRPRRVAGPMVGPDTGHAATVPLDGLPDAQTIAYRVRFAREAERGASAWSGGLFATPRADRFRLAWSGDTCGQGFGRNPDWGGMKAYATLREAKPAFFLHSGDMIYADNPILPEQKTWDGRIWRNVSNERVARVAQELDDFRARFAYNIEDDNVRALAAEVPILAQWDDHETHNNWWPGQQLDDERYTIERDASKLSAFARRAMLEWTPTPAGPVNRVVHYGPLLDVIVLDCRSFRTPNDTGGGTRMLGEAQVAWMIDALAGSKARWRIVACDQPIGLFITDGPNNDRIEGFADGTAALVGREQELAKILPHAPKNTIWVTTDVHHAQATRYARDDFAPFWEFIAGPIHAGSFAPPALDKTFGPDVKFQWGPEHPNMAPWDGLANFGTVDVTRDALTVQIVAVDGKPRYAVDLPYSG